MLQKSRDDYIKMCRHHHTAFDMKLWEDIGNKTGLCVVILLHHYMQYTQLCVGHITTHHREGGRVDMQVKEVIQVFLHVQAQCVMEVSFFLSFCL